MLGKVPSVLAFLGAISLSATAIAAETCPVGDTDIEKAGSYMQAVAAVISDAPDCDRAARLLHACQLGSSGDNALSTTVQEKCEPIFMGKASAATKRAYQMALDRCDKIAMRNAGTMYQSFAAVCRADAARDFARKEIVAKRR
ncbi:hypothetical protein [Methylovirgula sp. 4M-Z18]|uniref:hypothetical protein n=1 Tax=Methylovirgula sp. 4M-Z18 TaxID=2293567 RepID=UPI000E2F08FE|nr:hypothetical protein [Methylovirgula sp. 4M-Z18]RFB76427.1 hypothetical protein DYH55_20000 [Methylovirgula sp. 4M-Z18]